MPTPQSPLTRALAHAAGTIIGRQAAPVRLAPAAAPAAPTRSVFADLLARAGQAAPAPAAAPSAAPTVRPNRPRTAFPTSPSAALGRALAGRVTSAFEPAPTAISRPLPLDKFPRPAVDNGRGMHWVPTTSSPPETVDRYVSEAKAMGVSWMVFLNDGAKIDPANDYLVKKLTEAGIEPVMRLYTPTLGPIAGDVEKLVRHYKDLGVHYFQPYNEPNLKVEQPDGRPSVERYLDHWLPAAKAITRAGGLPGFGSLAPGGDAHDVQFLRSALKGLKARGEVAALDSAWLSIHNYASNNPVETRPEDAASGELSGFSRFRTYHRILQQELGRDLPLLGTEGGAYAGDRNDPTRPALGEAEAVDALRRVYEAMQAPGRDPWNLAYSYWVIANEAGGGKDPGFTRHALFRADGSHRALVDVLKGLG